MSRVNYNPRAARMETDQPMPGTHEFPIDHKMTTLVATPPLSVHAMQHPSLVIFDMAGTTVQDRGEVPAAFTAALAAEGIGVTPEQLTAVRGASKRQAVLNLLPPSRDRQARAERAYAAFKTELARQYAASVRSIPGAAETFAWLRERGVRLALNTGF